MLTTKNTQAIQEAVTTLGDAWNANDMKAYASCLTEDCDWINIVGMHWRGKASVMKAHTVYLSTMFLGVQLEILESEIAEIAPDVALVVVTIRMGDFTTPDGRLEKNMQDRMTYVMVKQPDESWLIRAAHNTTINPLATKHDPTIHVAGNALA
jgi:uncharacterized protein (TIGR02246 family)